MKDQQNVNAPKTHLNELTSPFWSVVSFDKREAGNLTYEQSKSKIQELTAQKVAGLCIITDEAAERMTITQPNRGFNSP